MQGQNWGQVDPTFKIINSVPFYSKSAGMFQNWPQAEQNALKGMECSSRKFLASNNQNYSFRHVISIMYYI